MKSIAVFLFTVLFAISAQAQLVVEVTRGNDKPIKVGVVPFDVEGTMAREDVASIIDANLVRSGQFETVGRGSMLSKPIDVSEVAYRDWRLMSVDYLVLGSVKVDSTGASVSYQLIDVSAQRLLEGASRTRPVTQLRDIAHWVSDKVYEKLTGFKGAFGTQIAFVKEKRVGGKPLYQLMRADADGAREKLIFESRAPIMSPSWSPDASKIAYVSFESGRPRIMMHDLVTNRRDQLTDFRGLNSSPAWSPKGDKIAMVLSKDDNPEIYLLDLNTRQFTRMTRHYAIDTEPTWTHDGEYIIFTSNRGGKPQIYQVHVATGAFERLTFEGEYNARPRATLDGKGLVFVHQRNGIFHIAIQDIASGRIFVLTQTSLDESPTVSPNGRTILYATRRGDQQILASVSVDGGVKINLPASDGAVREPAWAPYSN